MTCINTLIVVGGFAALVSMSAALYCWWSSVKHRAGKSTVVIDRAWYITLLIGCANDGCGCEKIEGQGDEYAEANLPCSQCRARNTLKQMWVQW